MKLITNITKGFFSLLVMVSLITITHYTLTINQVDSVVKLSRIVSKIDIVNMIIIKPKITNIKELFPARSQRKMTKNIIIHHSASSDGNVFDIDNYHKNKKGWQSIAYHFFISKQGTIYQLHDINNVDASSYGNNSNSVSVCLQGNFDKEYISKTQYYQLIKTLLHLKKQFPKAEIKAHHELNATSCFGENLNITAIRKTVSNFHWLQLLKK